MPVYSVEPAPKLVTGVNSDAYILKNSGNATIYLGMDSSLTVESRAWSLPAGSVLQWPGKTSEVWVCTGPGDIGELEILYNSQANFTPGPDNVNATIVGPVDVTGSVGIFGPVEVEGNVGITGPVDVTGTVDVSGPVTVTGDVGVTGPVTVNGAVDVTGDVGITGPVDVTGTVDVSGPVTVTGDVGVTGPVTVNGAVDVTGDVGITGPVDVTGTVGVSGPVTVTGDVGISGPVDINGDVNVVGGVTIDNSVLNVGGTVTAAQDSELLRNVTLPVAAGATVNVPIITDAGNYGSVQIIVTSTILPGAFTAPANNNTSLSALWSAARPSLPPLPLVSDDAETSLYGVCILNYTVKGDGLTFTITNNSAVALSYNVIIAGFTSPLPESYFHSWRTAGTANAYSGFTGVTQPAPLQRMFSLAIATAPAGVICYMHVDSYAGDVTIPYMRFQASGAVSRTQAIVFHRALADTQSILRKDEGALASAATRVYENLDMTALRAPLCLTVASTGAASLFLGNFTFKG